MRTIDHGGGTENCNGITIFSFLAFFQITVLVLAIFLAFFSTGFFLLSTEKNFLVIFSFSSC
jgi:hypothetical protein